MPWVERQDRAIRSRLQRGDEETIVNWLLFGTTFTKLPRVPLDSPDQRAEEAQRAKLYAAWQKAVRRSFDWVDTPG
jgi:hypothetical protein